MRWHFIRIYTKLHIRKLRGQAHWLCQSPQGGGCRPLRPARPAPAQRNQASESILDEKQGRAAAPLPLKGLRPYEDWLRQCFYPPPIPHKKNEPPIRSSLALPEFVPKNQRYPIWRNNFGAKNAAQAKQRGRSVFNIRESRRYREDILTSTILPKKRTSHNGGSSILPEFVPKKLRVPDLAQCFWMKSEGGTGRQPLKGLTPLTPIALQ